MEQWMVALIDSDVALKVNSLLGFVWLGLFFVYYFSREGRDERGRKVIAIAALCAFIMLFIVMNVLGYVRLRLGRPERYADDELSAGRLQRGAADGGCGHPDRAQAAGAVGGGRRWER